MSEQKKITLISTRVGKPGQEDKWKIFNKIIPEAKIYNIIDDSLVEETKEAGHITPNVIARLAAYYRCAELSGADLIYNQCTVTVEAGEKASQCVNIPVVLEGPAMAEEAAKLGGRIAVISPMMASVEPICELINEKAEKIGAEVETLKWVLDNANAIQQKHGEERFLQLFADYIKIHRDEADVFVLAQGNLGPVADLLEDLGKPVLTSSETGIKRAREILFGKDD